MGFRAALINASSSDSLRCALWFLLSTRLSHIICLTVCLFLFFSFSLFHVTSLASLCPTIFFSDFLWFSLFIRPCTYLSDCSAHVLSVCVYVCDERHWIICITGENGWCYNKIVEMDVRIAYGVLGDLARSSRERAQPPWFKESYFCFRSGLLQGIWREYRVYEGE